MEILSPFQIAFSLLVTLEPELMGIISLSLGVSLAFSMRIRCSPSHAPCQPNGASSR